MDWDFSPAMICLGPLIVNVGSIEQNIKTYFVVDSQEKGQLWSIYFIFLRYSRLPWQAIVSYVRRVLHEQIMVSLYNW